MTSSTTTWPIEKLGSLCEQVRGVSYSKGDASDTPSNGLVPILRANNILDDGRLAFDDLIFVPPRVVSRSQMLRKRDVVVAASSGSLSVVGKAAPVLSEWCGAFGAFCKVLRPNNKVDPRYFAYFFRTTSYRHRISQLAAGININNLRNEHLDELEIPLPPLSEQKRIADILDKADILRRKRQEARLLAQEMPLAAFRVTFERFLVPDRTETVLSEVAEVVSGVAKGRKLNGATIRQVPYLRVANVQAGRLDLSEIKTIPAKESEVEALALQYGDVVMTEGGDHDKLGRGALWEHDVPDCIHQNHVFRVRTDRKKLLPTFFVNYLQTQPAKRYFLRCAKKTTNLASINMTQLRALPVPLPPVKLQTRYDEQLRTIAHVTQRQTASEREANGLFNSLVQRAFTGEL